MPTSFGLPIVKCVEPDPVRLQDAPHIDYQPLVTRVAPDPALPDCMTCDEALAGEVPPDVARATPNPKVTKFVSPGMPPAGAV